MASVSMRTLPPGRPMYSTSAACASAKEVKWRKPELDRCSPRRPHPMLAGRKIPLLQAESPCEFPMRWWAAFPQFHSRVWSGLRAGDYSHALAGHPGIIGQVVLNVRP
jgi:hypothetical protein